MITKKTIACFALAGMISIVPIVNAQEPVVAADDCVTFRMPAGVKRWSATESFPNNEHTLRVVYHDEGELRRSPPYMLSSPVRELLRSDKDVTNSELLALARPSSRFIWLRSLPMSREDSSWASIQFNGRVVGEYAFSASADGLLAPYAFGYVAKIVVGGGLLTLYYTFPDHDQTLVSQLEALFVKRKDGWYWQNAESRATLHEGMINQAPWVPSALRFLHSSWAEIVGSLRIVCD